jgi:hypothetical protein
VIDAIMDDYGLFICIVAAAGFVLGFIGVVVVASVVRHVSRLPAWGGPL